jgi:predicted alpha/beta-hydrolase family hydrolase
MCGPLFLSGVGRLWPAVAAPGPKSPTAKELGAVGVLALSYPLLGPGSARELLSTDLPLLIIQGGNDPYGRPDQFPPLPSSMELVEIPFANHTFGMPISTGFEVATALEAIMVAVTNWMDQLLDDN